MENGAVRRYVLVPRVRTEPARRGGGRALRRYSLARVAPAPRSELGYDRHERLERVAEQELRPPRY